MNESVIERIRKTKALILKYETKKDLISGHENKMYESHLYRHSVLKIYDNLFIYYNRIISSLNNNLNRQDFLNSNNYDLYLDVMSNLRCPCAAIHIDNMFNHFSEVYTKKPNFEYTLRKLAKVRSFEVFEEIDCYFFNNSDDKFHKQNLNYLFSSTVANINYIIKIIEDSNLHQKKDTFNFLINVMLSIKDKAIARITYIAICDETLQKSICYEKIISSIARTTNYKIARSIYEIALYDDNVFQKIKAISPSNYNQIIELAGFISWDGLFDKSYILKEAKKIK